MSLTFTPTNANNWLYIDVVCNLGHSSAANAFMAVTLFKDSDVNAIAANRSAKAGFANAASVGVLTHRVLASSTAAQTFKVRAGASSAGTTTFNGQSSARKYGGTMASSIHIREVSPYKILPSGILQGIVLEGTGTPEGVVTAGIGALFTRTDGGASTTLYVKESGTGNTGWVAK